MDDYPESYVAHNAPLVVFSGLGSQSIEKSQANAHRLPHGDGATVQSDLPPVTGERADELLNHLMAASADQKPMAGKGEPTRSGLVGFQLEAVGRVGLAHHFKPMGRGNKAHQSNRNTLYHLERQHHPRAPPQCPRQAAKQPIFHQIGRFTRPSPHFLRVHPSTLMVS